MSVPRISSRLESKIVDVRIFQSLRRNNIFWPKKMINWSDNWSAKTDQNHTDVPTIYLSFIWILNWYLSWMIQVYSRKILLRNTNSKIEKNVSFLRKATILQPKTIFWCFKVVCTLMHFGLKLRLTHKKDPYCMAQWEIYKGQPLCKQQVFPYFSKFCVLIRNQT